MMEGKERQDVIDEFQKMHQKVLALTHEERMHICDMGFYNDAIKGYLIVALRNKAFKNDQIERALEGLHWALGETTADEATVIYHKFPG